MTNVKKGTCLGGTYIYIPQITSPPDLGQFFLPIVFVALFVSVRHERLILTDTGAL